MKRQSGQAPKFITPITPQVNRHGDNALFKAVITGAPIPFIQWMKDKVIMHVSSDNIIALVTS